jgi:hypothetical protein
MEHHDLEKWDGKPVWFRLNGPSRLLWIWTQSILGDIGTFFVIDLHAPGNIYWDFVRCVV